MRHIISDPEILGGKPIVDGTCLIIEHILGLLSHDMSHADIVEAHPEMTVEDINEALRYATTALHNEVVIEVESTREAA